MLVFLLLLFCYLLILLSFKIRCRIEFFGSIRNFNFIFRVTMRRLFVYVKSNVQTIL